MNQRQPIVIIIMLILSGIALVYFVQTKQQTGPKQVIIIRHGEKEPESPELSTKGKERAEALAPYLKNRLNLDHTNLADTVFAKQHNEQSPSPRPSKTIEPFAHKEGLIINEDFGVNQEQDLANHIMADPRYRGKIILICWEHKHIPALVKAFGYPSPTPDPWPDDIFDRTLVLDFTHHGVCFKNLPQQLLWGDSQA